MDLGAENGDRFLSFILSSSLLIQIESRLGQHCAQMEKIRAYL